MKFVDFLNEAPSTGHAKVESVIRSLKLNYKNDKSDQGRAFYLDHGYVITSLNNGDVILNKTDAKGDLGKIKGFEVLDATKLLTKVEELLKKHAPELFGESTKAKEKKTA